MSGSWSSVPPSEAGWYWFRRVGLWRRGTRRNPWVSEVDEYQIRNAPWGSDVEWYSEPVPMPGGVVERREAARAEDASEHGGAVDMDVLSGLVEDGGRFEERSHRRAVAEKIRALGKDLDDAREEADALARGAGDSTGMNVGELLELYHERERTDRAAREQAEDELQCWKAECLDALKGTEATSVGDLVRSLRSRAEEAEAERDEAREKAESDRETSARQCHADVRSLERAHTRYVEQCLRAEQAEAERDEAVAQRKWAHEGSAKKIKNQRAQLAKLERTDTKMRMAPEWRPIETAPFNEPVFISGNGLRAIAYFDNEKGWAELWSCYSTGFAPTHWMPAPSAPEAK